MDECVLVVLTTFIALACSTIVLNPIVCCRKSCLPPFFSFSRKEIHPLCVKLCLDFHQVFLKEAASRTAAALICNSKGSCPQGGLNVSWEYCVLKFRAFFASRRMLIVFCTLVVNQMVVQKERKRNHPPERETRALTIRQ